MDDDLNPDNINSNVADSAQKRKSCENIVLQLTDNKSKHLEENLSAAELDKILINDAKDWKN